MADSVQEMSFQNVVETILKPQGIKVGGYPDELFIDMDEKDRERWQCNICYLVLRDPRQCDNKHKFCNTCVFAWSMTYGANSDKCPVCRTKQHEYSKDVNIASEISLKWVKCPEVGCALRCSLADYLRHSHGIKQFANSDSNAMDNVRQTRRPPPIGTLPVGAELVFLPTLNRGNVTGQGTVREGRNLLQDMLLVLHLEMELRRRAIDRFSTTTPGSNATANQVERDRHMTEVLAIQEQMQEITGFLNILFSIPPHQSRRVGGMATFPGPSHHDDSSSESDDSDSSVSTIAVDSQYRLTQRSRMQTNPTVAGNRNTSGPDTGNVTLTSLTRPLSRTARRSEIRQELDNVTNASTFETTTPAAASSVSRTAAVTNTSRAAAVTNSSRAAAVTNTSRAAAVTNTSRAAAVTNSSRAAAVTSTSRAAAVTSTSRAAAVTSTSRPVPNRIDINNNPASSVTAANQTTANDTPVANSVRRGNDSVERNAVLQDLPGENSNTSVDGQNIMPRPSSTFQSALEQLPPIGAQATSSPINEISTNQPSNLRPGATPAPHRRPAPPATQGRPINTTRIRHRIPSNNQTRGDAVSSNNISQQNSTGSVGTTSQANQRGTNNGTSGGQQNRSGLPATAGALLRARRRSEIQQQIHRDMSNDDNS